MMNFTKVTTHQSTWIGQRGTLTTLHLTTRRYGPRVTVLDFEDGTVEVKGIVGDGRTDGFTEHYAVTLTRPSAAVIADEMRNAYNTLTA